MITLATELITRDSDGALFVRYIPTYKSTTCLSSGSLTFAVWDCAVGDSQAEHDRVKAKARTSAVESFRLLAEQLK